MHKKGPIFVTNLNPLIHHGCLHPCRKNISWRVSTQYSYSLPMNISCFRHKERSLNVLIDSLLYHKLKVWCFLHKSWNITILKSSNFETVVNNNYWCGFICMWFQGHWSYSHSNGTLLNSLGQTQGEQRERDRDNHWGIKVLFRK